MWYCITQLMQLSALCLSACFGDGPMALRIAGMETVLAIYSAYDQHRKSIWGELIDKRLSMPDEASREARRVIRKKRRGLAPRGVMRGMARVGMA